MKKTVTLTCNVVNVTSGSWVGIAKVGGVQVRGRRCDTAFAALGALLFALSDQQNDDAVLGLQLELEGSSLDAALAELPAAE